MLFSPRRFLVIACVFSGTLVASAVSVRGQAYTTVTQNGPSNNRVDMVFVGDGYLAADLTTTYPQHVANQVAYMFQGSQQPFPRYRNFFNIHRVNLASNQRGADKPPQGIFVDTALDSSYWWDGVTERLLYFDTGKANTAVNSALAGSGIDVDIRLGTVNDAKYGGGGGQWAVYAGQNSSAREVALHELGHSFGGLADEYFTNGTTYSGGEPSAPNVTRSASTAKWDRWLGYNDPSTNIGPIGYYQGGQYYQFGIYRPSNNSKMRSLDRPFDAISREQFISRIYAEVDPLDTWLTNAAPLQDPSTVWVDSVDPAVIQVQWSLNGSLLPVMGETLQVNGLHLAPGNYQLTARAYDSVLDFAFTGGSLDWYRLPNTAPLQQQIQWQLVIPARAGDFDQNGRFECTDVDALVATIATGGQGVAYDLDGDGNVDSDDLTTWLSLAGARELASGNPFLPGDANLDGSVDGTDFNLWNANKFTSVPAWCRGDFTADGAIDGSDFGIWNAHKFQSADFGQRLMFVPEPAISLSAGVWGLIIVRGMITRRQIRGRMNG